MEQMYNATRISGEDRVAHFFATRAIDGRAVLVSSPRREPWGRTALVHGKTIKPVDDPDVWLCRIGSTFVVVDDYDPQKLDGYICECSPDDTVHWIIACWERYRDIQRDKRKVNRALAKAEIRLSLITRVTC